MMRCLDCPELTPRGSRCPSCQRRHELGRSTRRAPSGWERQRVTAAVIARDGGCVDAGEHSGRLEVDHVVPLTEGGANEMGNLVTRCASHHREKGRGG